MAESLDKRIIEAVLAELPHWDDEPDTVYAARIAARVCGPVLDAPDGPGLWQLELHGKSYLAFVHGHWSVGLHFLPSMLYARSDNDARTLGGRWLRLHLPEFPPEPVDELAAAKARTFPPSPTAPR